MNFKPNGAGRRVQQAPLVPVAREVIQRQASAVVPEFTDDEVRVQCPHEHRPKQRVDERTVEPQRPVRGDVVLRETALRLVIGLQNARFEHQYAMPLRNHVGRRTG
jgi:hypothetical protein